VKVHRVIASVSEAIRDCEKWTGLLRRFAPRNDRTLTPCQNFSTQGRNSTSQLQALRGCCNTFQ
jgi:hypothetical protein